MSGRSTRLTSLADVAARAGVSITTASRVLSGSQHPVADPTRAKVMAAASELDAQPNLLARGLVMQRAPSSWACSCTTSATSFRIVRGIEDVAFVNGFSVVVCETDRDAEIDLRLAAAGDAEEQQRPCASGGERGPDPLQGKALRGGEDDVRLEAAGAVLLRLAPHATVEPDVSYSTHEGFGLLVDHLVELGHTEFAYVGAPAALNSTKVARHALAEVLFRNGIEFRADRMIPGDGTRAAGGEAAKQLVEEGLPVTAVLAATDHAAAGLVEAFGALGVDVPSDVSVVGFGDLTLAHDVGLTTVHVPLTDVATPRWRVIWYLGGGARPRQPAARPRRAPLLRSRPARASPASSAPGDGTSSCRRSLPISLGARRSRSRPPARRPPCGRHTRAASTSYRVRLEHRNAHAPRRALVGTPRLRVRNARVRAQMLLDLVGETFKPPRLTIALTSFDPHEPVVVDPCEIASAQPTVGGEPVAEIAGGLCRLRPHLQLVVAARTSMPACGRLPRRASPRRTPSSRPRSSRHLAAQLRLAVAVEDRRRTALERRLDR